MTAWNARVPRRARSAIRAVLIGLVAMALIGVPSSVAAAPSCVVQAQGTGLTYGTLQAALNASSAGVTLIVRGVCVGTTVVSKNATIRGATLRPSFRSALDGANSGPVIRVTAGVTVSIERLVITRGYVTDPGGGGILNYGTVIVKRSLVIDNTGHFGGGIANFGHATILDSTIDHNGNYRGGNIYNAGTLLVKDSKLTRGGGRWGQGLWNGLGATATLVRTSVTDNDQASSPLYGGGIDNDGALTLDHSNVSRNASVYGGGIVNKGTAHVIASTVAANTSQYGGGGILNGPALFDSAGAMELFLTDSTVTGNSSYQGGGIYNKGAVTLAGQARIGGNTAGGAGQGGGIFNDPGASVGGVTPDTFTPPNVPDDCVGCASKG